MTDLEALRRRIAADERNLRDLEKRFAVQFQLGERDELHALKVCADCTVRWEDANDPYGDPDDFLDALKNLRDAVALVRRFR